MTKAEQQQAVAILVPGQFNDHAVGRIDRTFSHVWIERADASLVTDELRRTVRGIAAFGGINAALMDALPNLEIIANFGVGYDSVDARHAAQRGVMVTNTPDVLTEEVADTAIGLLINTIRDLPRAETWLRDGSWARNGNYPLSRLTLRGRSVGIFGMGRIGLAIARRLEAFGLPIAYHNRRRVEGLAYEYHGTLIGLAEAVDTLISVAPGGASTEKAVNAEILSVLGPNGVFVNIGRGSTVDEAALAAALANGTIAAAGLDVFADEPNVPPALLAAPNTSLLPHVGSASEHTRRAMADLCVDNLISWFSEGRALTPVPETEKVKARS
ncbi:MAG: 2-hydroxyacid dehydrogenase [Mesorhizobium sp.]|uniref:2-hydroxyacid dehydrogenase n=3 Tax=Mesorhizobium TaxID=68287 RepID=UPI000FCA672C|nr:MULTISPECIES: 2-hydroxyacid dehydrogenase [unclassified Mesorhizobium]RUV54736.1 2-hydroxyacid dehydrogenase [Mesorhizobium sp. M5C.F.Ca.IN.020.29.1.1]RWC46899.1 MAG: 2-hydroxyacid dehydrogenase [Mesorhizobium sp.]RWD49436.1 MAG: 2-hydroxyacid dehydrogenase [Mesorhizobium sp.]RWE13233.1 MAG: 2-hydroxyacid dehydrogenase [Mesorhizobium sp.]RWE53037.1 MAG: 2-hydroxyacid dehydrogenase [Mesorhizobium sp.]